MAVRRAGPAAKYADRRVRLVPFRFNADQAYVLEFGDGYIRFFQDAGRIETAAITTSLANGDFAADISGWTDNSTGGGAISHDASSGRLSLDVTAGAHIAWAEQTASGDLGASARALVRLATSWPSVCSPTTTTAT